MPGARRPVMVYTHGRAYSAGSGSSSLHDGARLCRRGDVVVVFAAAPCVQPGT